MATNQGLQNVNTLSLPVHAGVVSGDPVIAGTQSAGQTVDVSGINGVALTAISAGDNPTGSASVATCGAFRVSVATNLGAAGALTIGDVVYYDVITEVLSSDITKNPWGKCLETKGAGEAAAVILVAIIPSV